jgi:hydroperoxide dehydratase
LTISTGRRPRQILPNQNEQIPINRFLHQYATSPLISSNPNVVVLLHGKSFPIVFDNSKVEKHDLFTKTYMPSTELIGGNRILSYLADANDQTVSKWTMMQLSPILSLGLPKCIEEPVFHTFCLAPILVKKDCKKLYDFFTNHLLDRF